MVAWHLRISRDTACRYGVTASDYRNRSLKSGRGCVMKERNQKQRRHIRAARQWLGEAEHSLAENHRVRGELKVMLAKAELARVEGTPGHRFVKKWSMRILPALAAMRSGRRSCRTMQRCLPRWRRRRLSLRPPCPQRLPTSRRWPQSRSPSRHSRRQRPLRLLRRLRLSRYLRRRQRPRRRSRLRLRESPHRASPMTGCRN